MISILLFVAAVVCYVVSQLQQHGKLKWMDEKKPFGFWGEHSDKRKYKRHIFNNEIYQMYIIKPNWYSKLVGTDYKEKWFTSTWLTVAFSDGYHAAQAIMKVFICLAIVLYEPIFKVWWWNFIGFWALFGVVFFISYRIFARKVS